MMLKARITKVSAQNPAHSFDSGASPIALETIALVSHSIAGSVGRNQSW